MVGLHPVGVVHHRAPPPNPYSTQFQAPNGSSVVQAGTSDDNTGGNSNGSATTREYAQVLRSKGLNPRIKFNDRESEGTTSTREPYVPSEGVSIPTDLPALEGEGTPENPGSLSIANEYPDGRSIDGKMHPDLQQPNFEKDLKVITPDQIVVKTNEEAKYAMAEGENPIDRAMASEGILKTDD